MNEVEVGFVITTKGTYQCSLRANPLVRSPGQVKQHSDKWKLWKNLV